MRKFPQGNKEAALYLNHRLLRDITWLSIPSMSSMEKKRMAHSGEIGNCVTASGYAKNAKPGPVKEKCRHETKFITETPDRKYSIHNTLTL